MKENNIVLITLTTDPEHQGFKKLKQSLEKFDWPHVVLKPALWEGFCTKILGVYEFLKANPHVTHFFFCDANDVVVLGTMEEALSKINNYEQMLFSAERGCFPLHYLSKYYPEQQGRYNYLNSGLYFAPSMAFIEMVEFSKPTKQDEDQSYMNIQYLLGKWNLDLDFKCNVFQSYSFIDDNDFEYKDGRLINLVTGTTPVFAHGNGRQDMTKVYDLLDLETLALPVTLAEWSKQWHNELSYHKYVNETFAQLVNRDEELKQHRDFVETAIWGFGERSFWWLWLLILAELPDAATMAEIGCFRGATLSLWRMLKPESYIFGITPLDSSDGHFESDYAADIKFIHDKFNLRQPLILKGRSDDERSVKVASTYLFDLIYIDGSHQYNDVVFDLNTYCEFLKIGGYFVIDDSNCEMPMPFGYFTGIADVTKAKQEWIEKDTEHRFEFVFSVVHISVFKRVK